jgi:hypothetical protein
MSRVEAKPPAENMRNLQRVLGASLSIALVAALVPAPVQADHGWSAVYVSTASTCVITVAGKYVSGGGNFQTWDFLMVAEGTVCAVGVPDGCRGFGSPEVGFVRTGTAHGLGCPTDFELGGTGHFHPCCPIDDVDVHSGVWIRAWGATVPAEVVITNV